MYHLGSNTDRVDALVEKFARPGEHTIAVDGSGPTVETWLPPAVRAKAQTLNIPEVELGIMTSRVLIEQIVGTSIQKSPHLQNQMSVIVDHPHFPAAIGGNDKLVPKLDTTEATDVPFVNVMAEQGIPVLCKGDGEKTDTGHKIFVNGEYKHVWETVATPMILDGLKTHYFHDGKSAFNTTLAARAAAEQAAAALFNGLLAMPEPDIDKYTSIDADKTAKSYGQYYDVLMRNMQELYPDYDIHQLGAKMATKLGPVEDGEHTNGPAERFNMTYVRSAAEETAKLIREIHEKTGIRGFRMLSNGRPLGPMIQVVDAINRRLSRFGDPVFIGTSLSSAQMKEALQRGAPIINPRSQELELENRGLARDFHGQVMKVCQQASAGKLDQKDLKALDIKIAK